MYRYSLQHVYLLSKLIIIRLYEMKQVVQNVYLSTVKPSLNVLGLWCLTPLSTKYFSYIVAVSFIGGEN